MLVSFSWFLYTIWHIVCVLYHGWINWDHQSYLKVQLLEFISINNEYTGLLYSEFRGILLYEKHFVLFIAMEILGLVQRMIHVGRLLRSPAVRCVFQLLSLSKGRKIFRWWLMINDLMNSSSTNSFSVPVLFLLLFYYFISLNS